MRNNYVQQVNGSAVHDNGVGIQLTNMIIDKSKLALSFDLKFDNPEIIKILKSADLDFQIKYDKGRIIKGYNSQDLSDKNVLKAISSAEDNFQILDKEKGEARYNIIMNSVYGNIPVINKIDISIRAIHFIYVNSDTQPNDNEIPGEWSLNVDVNSEFKNNNSILFTAENTDSEVKVKAAETTSTGTTIKFICPEDASIDIFKNIYLINDKGVGENGAGSVSTQYDEENNAVCTITFPVSIFESPKDLKFSIKNYNGRNIEIKLNRNER